MCLIAIAYNAHPRYPLLVAANRDEFHRRPARPAGFWPEAPGLLAGRDIQAGGTWMGLSLDGRFAAVTNFREPASPTTGERSRGDLVRDFLTDTESARDFCRRVTAEGEHYGGFSLLAMDGESLWFAGNRGDGAEPVQPGVHGLSNEHLDSPWPKVERIRAETSATLERPRPARERLFRALGDTNRAPDETLPDTGVGLERERLLSAPFIADDTYGTRASTLVLVDAAGRADFEERGFGPGGVATVARRFRFSLERAPFRRSRRRNMDNGAMPRPIHPT